MAKLTIVVGVVLVLLGGGYFVASENLYTALLIPAAFGLVLCLSGVMANTRNSKKRMLWMHVAVTVGLIGFLGGAAMVVRAYIQADGFDFFDPTAVDERGAMAVICLIFVGLCVRSFIAARRGRSASA